LSMRCRWSHIALARAALELGTSRAVSLIDGLLQETVLLASTAGCCDCERKFRCGGPKGRRVCNGICCLLFGSPIDGLPDGERGDDSGVRAECGTRVRMSPSDRARSNAPLPLPFLAGPGCADGVRATGVRQSVLRADRRGVRRFAFSGPPHGITPSRSLLVD